MFIAAIVFNILSSYFVASVYKSVLIIFVSFFALVVLNVEILSLFEAIGKNNLFVFAFLNFILTFAFFKYKKAKFLKPDFNFIRFKHALLLDKTLMVLLFAFLFLLFVALFLSFVMPTLEPDGQTYHFLRAVEFLENKSLSHFETNDIRALIMPFNSEVFYAWMLAFKNNFRGYGLLSFFSYIFAIFCLWDIFEKFKFSYRKRLYAIFILSSFSAVIVQMMSLQTDILVGSLLLGAFAFFARKNAFFSSLCLALALGIKTTAFGAVFSFLIVCTFYEILVEKEKKFLLLRKTLMFLVFNFIIFSSYNYILNLVQFHSPFSNRAAYLGHCFWGGFGGFVANLINFFFQAFDFTGFKWGFYLNEAIVNFKMSLFKVLNINPLLGSNVAWQKVNIIADEQIVGFGVLGFLVFLPSVVYSFFRIFFSRNKRVILCFLFSLAFLINILFLCAAFGYMIYSIRFIVSYVVFSSVVLIVVYRKKSIIKPFVLFFCLFYMILLSTHVKRMPLNVVFKGLKQNNFNLEKFEQDCYRGKVLSVMEIAPFVYETICERYKDKKNIAFVKTLISSTLYLKKLENKERKIDFLNAAFLDKEKIKKYDLIILEGEVQNDNVFNPWEINIDYKVENSKVIFENAKKLNCYYIYADYHNGGIHFEDALERSCFSYSFLIKKPGYILDYKQRIKIKELSQDVNLYYFINQIND